MTPLVRATLPFLLDAVIEQLHSWEEPRSSAEVASGVAYEFEVPKEGFGGIHSL
jgi:hypothetical protein